HGCRRSAPECLSPKRDPNFAPAACSMCETARLEFDLRRLQRRRLPLAGSQHMPPFSNALRSVEKAHCHASIDAREHLGRITLRLQLNERLIGILENTVD